MNTICRLGVLQYPPTWLPCPPQLPPLFHFERAGRWPCHQPQFFQRRGFLSASHRSNDVREVARCTFHSVSSDTAPPALNRAPQSSNRTTRCSVVDQFRCSAGANEELCPQTKAFEAQSSKQTLLDGHTHQQLNVG